MTVGTRRILFINPTAKMSGAEFSLLCLMSGLERKQYRPLLLVPEEGDLTARAQDQGIESIVLPGMIRFGEFFHWYKIPKALLAVWRIRRLIRQKGIELVHSNTPRVSYMGSLAARLSGIPAVTHVREINALPFSSRLKGLALGFLNDAVIVVSQAVRDAILEKNPRLRKKINVVYSGVDPESFSRPSRSTIRREWSIPQRAPLIGCLGRIDSSKGLDVLVAAAAIWRDCFPDLHVLLVGPVFQDSDRDFQERLAIRIKAEGLGKRVIFCGFRSDIPAVLRELDLVVHPVLCPDALPRSLIEAAAAGKPVVASRVGGIPEIIGDNECGILVEAGNPRALAEAVLALLKNPKRAAQLGAAGRKRVAKLFSLTRHFRHVAEIYQKLLPADV